MTTKHKRCIRWD